MPKYTKIAEINITEPAISNPLAPKYHGFIGLITDGEAKTFFFKSFEGVTLNPSMPFEKSSSILLFFFYNFPILLLSFAAQILPLKVAILKFLQLFRAF